MILYVKLEKFLDDSQILLNRCLKKQYILKTLNSVIRSLFKARTYYHKKYISCKVSVTIRREFLLERESDHYNNSIKTY